MKLTKKKLYLIFMAGVTFGSVHRLGKYDELTDKELKEAFNKIVEAADGPDS